MSMATKKFLEDHRGVGLMGSLLVVIFLGVFMMLSFNRSLSHMQFQLVSQRADQALHAAEYGLEETLRELRNDLEYLGTNATQSISNGGIVFGHYDATVDSVNIVFNPPWQIMPLVITGQSADQDAQRVLNVYVRAQSPTAFFMSSLNDIIIAPGANIQSTGGPDDPETSLLARNIVFQNATAANPINLDGDVYYLQSLQGFDPNDPGATPHIQFVGQAQQISNVTFIGIDHDRYQTISGYAHAGDLSISAVDLNRSFNFSGPNSNANNGVVFVDGDVEISATVSESMVIVATGSIKITGDVKYSDSVGEDVQLGLFAKGDIIVENPGVNANRIVEGFLFSEGDIYADGQNNEFGTLDFFGSMSARGQIGATGSAVRLSAFQNRNYTWHSELFTDTTLPAMTYMVDVFEWSIQGDPGDNIQ